jgi:hypothetical protein
MPDLADTRARVPTLDRIHQHPRIRALVAKLQEALIDEAIRALEADDAEALHQTGIAPVVDLDERFDLASDLAHEALTHLI